MAEAVETVKREKVRHIPIDAIDEFPDHPFLVKDDEEMEKLVESIRCNGILNPIIVTKTDNERFITIAGHRRIFAYKKLGLTTIPAIVRELSRDDAVIAMVDSNLQREKILPSEKAKAYKMKMNAMRRKAGRPSKNNLAPVVSDLRTDEIIGGECGESREQVCRFIRLNELTPELLQFVDEGKLGLTLGENIPNDNKVNLLIVHHGIEYVNPSEVSKFEQ